MKKIVLDVNAIKTRILYGESIKEIANTLNVSGPTILARLKEAGIAKNVQELINSNNQARICRVCKIEKPITNFKKTSAYSSTGEPYRNRICRQCQIDADPEKFAEWDKTNKERQSIREKESRRDPAMRAFWICKSLKKQDRVSKRENNLNIEFINNTIKNGCSYCGESDILLMTLDRIDNIFGHLQSNVVPSCIRCNSIRSNMPYDIWLEFKPLLKKLREEGKFGNWNGFNKKLIYNGV